MIWIVIAVILLLSLVLLLRPAAAHDQLSSKATAIAHFKEQLAALEQDKRLGKISDDAFDVNKTEISRHLLRESNDDYSTSSNSDFTFSQIVPVLAVVTIASLVVYMQLGRPALKAAIPNTDKEKILNQPVSAQSDTTYAQALMKMETEIQKRPDDIYVQGLYARTLHQLQQFAKAANTYAKLSALQPNEMRWQVSHVESLMGLTDGQITPASMMIIDQMMHQYPTAPAPHYLKGLAHMQKGNKEDALMVWEAFTNTSAPDAPWMRSFMPQIRALKYPMPKVDPAAIQRVSSMGAEGQKAFFTAMADRLEARLKAIPDYPEGWMRLARTRMMTGDTPKAIAALKAGIKGSSDPAQAVPLKSMLDKMTESLENNKKSGS